MPKEKDLTSHPLDVLRAVMFLNTGNDFPPLVAVRNAKANIFKTLYIALASFHP